MQENFVSMTCAEGQSPNIEDLCVAMFIEGARVLGIDFHAPMALDAQEKILQAAAHALREKLALLLEFQGDLEPLSELPN
jgi:hypothetical protein